MSSTSSSLMGEKVRKVLKVLKDVNVDSIEPKVEFNSGVKYPIFDGTVISVEDVRESLLLLHEAGILKSEVVDNIAVCPHCLSHKLMIRTQCPSCGSPKLVRGRMIEHLACGHIDFEEKFKSGEVLFCPNCRKPLGQLGVDYRTFSSLYRCLNCMSVFSNPKIEYLCSSGHSFSENDLAVHSVMAFKVSPDKRSLIERMAFDVEDILKPLMDMGLSIKAPATLQGRSGIKHDFSFAIWYEYEDTPSIVGSIHLLDRALSATDVLALWAKANDVGVQHRVMITFSGVSEDGRRLAAAYNLKIIEGKDAQDAAEKVREHIAELLKGMKPPAPKAPMPEAKKEEKKEPTVLTRFPWDTFYFAINLTRLI
ncbi:MAG: hypothetical protein QXN24_05310 [Candidatus Bathyarchaeia archaeon]